MNRNFLNLLSNYGTRLFGALSVFVLIPIYIKIFGIENYGIIGFYSVLLAFLSFIDSGMSSVVMKEFSKIGKIDFKYSLLRNTEKLYILICIFVNIFVLLFSKKLSSLCFNSSEISKNALSYYLILITSGVTIQLLSSLYFGAIFGLNEQLKVNLIQFLWQLFKSILILPILFFYKSSLEIYFIWQIGCNIIYVVILRFLLMFILKNKGNLIYRYRLIPNEILTYIGGVMLVSSITALNSQIDKIVVSILFSLKKFGYYNVLSTISQIPLALVSPLGLFVFPLFSRFSNTEDGEGKLNLIFGKISYLINLIVIPVVVIICFNSFEMISLWVGKGIEQNLLSDLSEILIILTLAVFFISIQLPFYNFLLSISQVRYSLYFGFFQLIFTSIVLFTFLKNFGLIMIGFNFLFLNIIGYFFIVRICLNKYLSLKLYQYFFDSFLIPICVSLIICSCIKLICDFYTLSFYFNVLFSGLFSIILILIINNIRLKNKMFEYKYLYDFPN